MDLAKIKLLEDLKTRHKLLNQQIKLLITDYKTMFNKSTLDAFIQFFIEKGFQVKTDHLTCKAVYGEMEVSLKLSEPNEYYVGCYALYELKINHQSKSYTIPVIEANQENAFHYYHQTKVTPQIDINLNIATYQTVIAAQENFVQHKDQFKLGYTYYDTAKAKNNPDIKIEQKQIFLLFEDLLKTIFK